MKRRHKSTTQIDGKEKSTLTARAFRPERWGSSTRLLPARAQPREKRAGQAQPCRPGSWAPRRVFETAPVAVQHCGRRARVMHGGEQESALQRKECAL